MKLSKDQETMWNRLKSPAPEIDKNGTQRWYNKAGKRHRDNDMPAVIYKNGTSWWYKNGVWHRENNLPAKIWANGYKAWYTNGEFIRSEEPDE